MYRTPAEQHRMALLQQQENLQNVYRWLQACEVRPATLAAVEQAIWHVKQEVDAASTVTADPPRMQGQSV